MAATVLIAVCVVLFLGMIIIDLFFSGDSGKKKDDTERDDTDSEKKR